MLIKNILLTLILGSLTWVANGQNKRPEPVKWTFNAEKTGEDTYVLTFTADIEENWHVYSQFLEAGGPEPTRITFDNASEFRPNGKSIESGEKHSGYNKLFDMDVVDYSHQMVIKQEIKMEKQVGEVMGYITFMTCNGQTCLPPTDIPFIIPLN